MTQIIADQNNSLICQFGCWWLISRAKALILIYKAVNPIFHSTLNYRCSQGEKIYSDS